MASKEKKSKVKKLKENGKVIHISAQLLNELTEEDLQELEDMVIEEGTESFQRYMADSKKLMPKEVVMPPITWRKCGRRI